MRRFFFLLLFANLAYGAWAALVTPPPTVPVNQAFARLPHLKLVDELPPSERPDPAARKTADTPGQCLSVGPFGDVDNSAKAAALLRARGFDPEAARRGRGDDPELVGVHRRPEDGRRTPTMRW